MIILAKWLWTTMGTTTCCHVSCFRCSSKLCSLAIRNAKFFEIV